MNLNNARSQILSTIHTEPGLTRREVIERFQPLSLYTNRLRMGEIERLERRGLIEDRASAGKRSRMYLTDTGMALVETHRAQILSPLAAVASVTAGGGFTDSLCEW